MDGGYDITLCSLRASGKRVGSLSGHVDVEDVLEVIENNLFGFADAAAPLPIIPSGLRQSTSESSLTQICLKILVDVKSWM